MVVSVRGSLVRLLYVVKHQNQTQINKQGILRWVEGQPAVDLGAKRFFERKQTRPLRRNQTEKLYLIIKMGQKKSTQVARNVISRFVHRSVPMNSFEFSREEAKF